MALWRIALTLKHRAKKGDPVSPPLFFVTDPVRTPDPSQIAARLPKGSGVIYRAFGAPDALAIAGALRRVADRGGLILLIGADERLAAAVGADGVHLPQRLIGQGQRLRARRPGWILTGAAHDARALKAAEVAGLDAALTSPVFASRSPSAHTQLGPIRFANLVREARLPVYALGGVNHRTAPRLLSTGATGLAAVEGLV
jgi:thiamine-phosphate pyrophosphorylase